MLLTTLTDTIVTSLNSSPEIWTELSVTAVATLDWSGCLTKTQLQVLIVPEMVQYNLEQSARRRTIITTNSVKFVSVMVGKGFESLPTGDDVAPWADCKAMLDIRERITQFLISLPISGVALIDIEEIPVDELELNHRNFVAVTQFGYEDLQCGLGPDLLSS